MKKMATLEEMFDNKWHLVYGHGKDALYNQLGWRFATIGWIKVKYLPQPEGVKQEGEGKFYRGFILNFRYWLPWERA